MMKSVAEAIRAVTPGELRRVPLSAGALASGLESATNLRQGLEHHLRARVVARPLERIERSEHLHDDTNVDLLWFEVSGRSLIVLVSGVATLDENGDLEPGAAIAANGPLRFGAASPCCMIICEISFPTWRDWLTETYFCRAARAPESRRYALGASPSPSPPTAIEVREGLRALARQWHARRCARSTPEVGSVSEQPDPSSILVRRPESVLRVARAGGRSHLVCGRNVETCAVSEEHELVLRFIMTQDRFGREDLPVEMSGDVFVAVASRLIAIGAFRIQ